MDVRYVRLYMWLWMCGLDFFGTLLDMTDVYALRVLWCSELL
jgi:hypothetical protein